MRIELDNLYGRTLEASPRERAQLERAFLELQRDFPPTETRALYADGVFAAGLWPVLEGMGLEATILDRRPRPNVSLATLETSDLRDYQQAALEAALKHTRGILKLPTGAGKTALAAEIMKLLPCRWLFLVHRRALLTQTIERLRERGLALRSFADPRPGVVVATYQGLSRALSSGREWARTFLASVEGLVVDECHAAGAPGLERVVMETPNAYWRFGLSATPLQRGDKLDPFTIGALGPIIAQVDVGTLQDRGFLARGRAVFVPHKVSGAPKFGSWEEIYRTAIVSSTARNMLLCDLVERAEKPCLLFVREIRHGQALEAELTRRGVAALFISGEYATAARSQAIDALKNSHIDVLVSTNILEEGIDVPALRSVVVGTGGKSEVRSIQRLGRALRPAPGKDHFELFDVADMGQPALERHVKLRAQAYSETGIEVSGLPVERVADMPFEHGASGEAEHLFFDRTDARVASVWFGLMFVLVLFFGPF